MTMAAILGATYLAVFGAEIVGDKLLYTIGVLAGRFTRTSMAIGIATAFMVKMGAAVLVGAAIATLPRTLLLASTGVSFVGIAWIVWRQPGAERAPRTGASVPAAVALSFSAVVFSEWADLGQLTAAAMTARFGMPLVVWAGAVLAMMTKAALALTVGAGVQRWTRRVLPEAALRYVSVGLLLTIGTLSMLETLKR
jgi:Ca2+/H+ antiporter, TMEM165/GDT1 family